MFPTELLAVACNEAPYPRVFCFTPVEGTSPACVTVGNEPPGNRINQYMFVVLVLVGAPDTTCPKGLLSGVHLADDRHRSQPRLHSVFAGQGPGGNLQLAQTHVGETVRLKRPCTKGQSVLCDVREGKHSGWTDGE